MKYVLDTNVFNKVANGQIKRDALPQGSEFIATHIQIDEINKTPDADKRARLFLVFAEMAPKIVPTESGVLDVSKWDQFKWGDDVTYQKIKSALDSKNGAKVNNIQDALIAEVALKNSYSLITADSDLADVARDFGVSTIRI